MHLYNCNSIKIILKTRLQFILLEYYVFKITDIGNALHLQEYNTITICDIFASMYLNVGFVLFQLVENYLKRLQFSYPTISISFEIKS